METRPPRPPEGTDSPLLPRSPAAERFTVQDVEQQIRARGRRRSRSTTRSRSEQRRESQSLDKYVWIAVSLVAVGYLGVLAFHSLRGPAPAKKPPAPVAAPAAPAAPTTAVAVAESPEPVAEMPGPPPAANLAEVVKTLKTSDVLLDEARRQARERRFGDADLAFRKAAELTPWRYPVLFEWAESLREQKRWSAAREQLVKAVMVEPDSIAARLALAQACYQLKAWADAMAMASWVLEREPYSEPAHQVAADVLVAQERYSDALVHLQRLVALNSNNHIAENSLGAAHLRLGQYAQAIRCFESVIRDEPGNSQAYYYLALSFLQRNEPDLAVDVLARASSQFGREFVVAWTKSAEFAALQDVESFKRQFPATP